MRAKFCSNQCETNFEREIDLKAHIRSFHEGKKVLAACGCPKTHLTSIIDNAYLSLSELAELKVLKDSISDHYPIIVNLSTDVLSKGKLKTIFRRDITRLAVSDFEDALIAKDWSPLYMITDPDEALTLFLNKVNEALDVVAPIKAIKIRPDKPKISLKHDTLATMASRDEARKKGNKTCYKILRNKASKLVKRDKIQGILKNLKGNPGPKSAWQEAKILLGKGRGNTLPDCTTNSNQNDTAEHQNVFFINKIKNLVASLSTPFACDLCETNFKTDQSLKIHV